MNTDISKIDLNNLGENYFMLDCVDGMKKFPDKYFDIAIVDPPYADGTIGEFKRADKSRFGGKFDKYKKRGKVGGGYYKKYGKKQIDWDVAPSKEYFDELFRVSKQQIIWGGNYFNEFLPSNRNFIVWKKLTISEDFSMAMAEYAWTSINGNAKVYQQAPQGTAGKGRIHPTQKPIELYEWLVTRYCKETDKILDTHVGSASSLIAFHRLHNQFVGFEIDEDYYKDSTDRYYKETAQQQLF